MKKLLLLDNRYSADSNDIKKVANKLGWATERTNLYQVEGHCAGYDLIRYYGNTLHYAGLQTRKLPFAIHDIDPQILPRLKSFIKREMNCLLFKDLKQPIEKKQFIKPCREKWFPAQVYSPGETILGAPNGGDEIYVSDPVKFIDEVRCFVLYGKILTSSLYRINSIVWDATKEDPKDINFDSRINDTPIPEYCKKINQIYPSLKSVVMDFGLLENGEWALIEFNECPFSGLYYTDYEKAFECIINAQYDK
jgi:hypothetical protein